MNIIDIIKENNGKANYKKIAKRMDLDKWELEQELERLKLDGEILQLGNNYILFPNDLIMGDVSVSLTGRKYVNYNNERTIITADDMDKVILNDKVAFKINSNNEAIIISIIKRKLMNITCEVVSKQGKKEIIPYGSSQGFTFDKDTMNLLYDGDIILANISPSDIVGINNYQFIKKIGRRDNPLIDDITIAYNYGFDDNYSEEFMEEVNRMPKEVSEDELTNRIDYRTQHSFTIDGAYTKDMDDGVYAEMLDNDIIRVYVHIADVSHYIKKDSEIFKRAADKTTSLYMNNSVYHMLHHVISNGICSLNPLEDRLTKSVVMDIDRDGKIINYDIQKSVINSKMKMVYEDVDKVIMEEDYDKNYLPFKKELFVIYDAAMRLEKRFITANGKINFHSSELNIIYNDDGTIKTILDHSDSLARKIIENLMIAANSTVANYLLNLEMPSVYRIHEYPNINKINEVIMNLNHEGYNIKYIRDIDSPKSLQRVLMTLSSYPEFPVISQLLVMAMQRARYSVENMGHYALGLAEYCHFTSPIRRLPDLLVHMSLDLVLEEYDKINPEILKEYEAMFQVLALRSSRMERQADMAEHVAERRLILKKLEKNMDDLYVASVVELGKKIKLRVEGVDTFIEEHDLDYVFSYNKTRKQYYDKLTNNYIKIGTKLLVKLTSVSPVSDRLTLKVLDLYKEDELVKAKTLSKEK